MCVYPTYMPMPIEARECWIPSIADGFQPTLCVLAIKSRFSEVISLALLVCLFLRNGLVTHDCLPVLVSYAKMIGSKLPCPDFVYSSYAAQDGLKFL